MYTLPYVPSPICSIFSKTSTDLDPHKTRLEAGEVAPEFPFEWGPPLLVLLLLLLLLFVLLFVLLFDAV